jgi:FKBP-type peptidyl-prolyl cis-trans isomerase FkpA
MRNFVFILVLGLTGLYACQESGPQTSKLGNRFIVHTNGSGEAAKTGDFVYLHASMRKQDSIIFNTRDNGGQPTAVQVPSDSLGPDRVGPVEDVLRGRKTGDSITVIVRIDTLEFKPPGMEDVDEIYYDLVITDIVTEDEFAARREVEQAEAQIKIDKVIASEPQIRAMAEANQQAYAAGTLEGIQATPSGLKYVIHEEGMGAQAAAGSVVNVQYLGMLAENASIFDQSFIRGRGIEFPLGAGRVIPGWDEGIALLKEGSKATLIIPAELGYGASGTPDGGIPPGAELMFYVELEEVK